MLAFHRPARLLSGSAVRAFHVSRASRLPAILHPDLQAYKSLREEKAWVESSQSKPPPTISSLRICIVNLMPLKESTELQLCRMLARSPVATDIAWVVPNTYSGKNSTPGHLEKFYKRFNEVKGEKYDGIILTGAPIEHLDFEQVAAMRKRGRRRSREGWGEKKAGKGKGKEERREGDDCMARLHTGKSFKTSSKTSERWMQACSRCVGEPWPRCGTSMA